MSYQPFYRTYKDNGGTLDFSDFRKVGELLLKAAAANIVEGKAIPLAHRLGHIFVVRLKNDNRKPLIDWGNTRKEYLKRKEQGLPTSGPESDAYFKYFTPEWLIKVWWDRRGVLLAGIGLWQFVPCRPLKKQVHKYVTRDEFSLYDIERRS